MQRQTKKIKRLRQTAALLCFTGLAVPAFSIAAQSETSGYFEDSSASTQSSLRDLLSYDSSALDGRSNQDKLVALYQARDFKPIWSGSGTAESRAAAVKSALEHASDQGLRSADYTSALSQWSDVPQTGEDAAKYDIAMTAALLKYAKDVHSGRLDPESVYKDVQLPANDFDAAAALKRALRNGSIDSFLSDLPPPQPGYQRLVKALAQYRAIAAQGGWPAIPAGGTIDLDSGGSRVRALAKRLAFEDSDLADNPDPSPSELREAVLRFQRRHGLNDDGVVGPAVLRELNIPASHRVEQIVANMERWRWMPRSFESRYIAVNVPDQSLEFIDDGSVALHSRVVIGRKDNQTPILRTTVRAVVANPPWNIPDDIAAKMLPRIRKNPDYLSEHNMVMADGHIQQNPGEDNALGTLMLDAPNKFNVYMHDTPNKKLFLADTREMSHGCVRVEQILPLASLALTGSADDGVDDLNEAIAGGVTQRMPLSEPLPAYMLYWTAFAKSDDGVEFRDDLYDRDRILLDKLQNRGEQRRIAELDD